MATKTLANWAVNLQELPPSTRKAAVRSLYNYIGCAIGGSDHPTVTKAYKALYPLFGRETCTLLGTQSKTDLQHAALLNGIASHVHDYDDTHLATIIHPTGPVASALLAFAEYRGYVKGEELLLALVAGIEGSCKLGLAVWPEHYNIGWHITSTTGAIGAAVAVGKLMRLSEVQMAHAIGIAAVQVTGLREMFGSDTKSFHPGRAASSGIVAALLALEGYTSSETALEAKRGWANVVAGGGMPKLDELLDGLGKTWEIEANSFKPFPCGIVCHPAIDAATQCHNELINTHGLDPRDITNVSLRVHPLVVELTSKRKPRDGLEAKFSVFHGCAVGLLWGQATPTQYEDEIVTSPEVIDLRDRIDITADTTLTADEAYLSLTHSRGIELERHIEHAIGSSHVPMTDEQLSQKFLDQVTLAVGEQAAVKASAAAWGIGDAEDVASIIREFSSERIMGSGYSVHRN
jgi:aconitate decarboxylase